MLFAPQAEMHAAYAYPMEMSYVGWQYADANLMMGDAADANGNMGVGTFWIQSDMKVMPEQTWEEPMQQNPPGSSPIMQNSAEEDSDKQRQQRSDARRVLFDQDMGNLPGLLLLNMKAMGGTVAKAVARGGRVAKVWCSDRSTFSALNIDGLSRRRAAPKAKAASGEPAKSPAQMSTWPSVVALKAEEETSTTTRPYVASTTGNFNPFLPEDPAWRPVPLVVQTPTPPRPMRRACTAPRSHTDLGSGGSSTPPTAESTQGERTQSSASAESTEPTEPGEEEDILEPESHQSDHLAVRSMLMRYRSIVVEANDASADLGLRAVAHQEAAPAPAFSSAASSGKKKRQAPAPLSGLSPQKNQKDEARPMERTSTPNCIGKAKSAPDVELHTRQPLLTPSANAWRRAPPAQLSHSDALKRAVNGLLNKACPERLQSVSQQLSEVNVRGPEDLELVISLILEKALAEPHYCETYADLAFSLKAAFPEFPTENGEKPFSFKICLLNICQREFESLPESQEEEQEALKDLDPEEAEYRRKRSKDRQLANMKFIGHLFLRQLLSVKIIRNIAAELTFLGLRENECPQETSLDCVCELLINIGHTLESFPGGVQAVQEIIKRLHVLSQRTKPDGRMAYSKRFQFAVQDLREVQSAGWTRRTFKSTAKTLQEVRHEHQRQARAATGPAPEEFVAGVRPAYLQAPTTPAGAGQGTSP